jgi:hypothetical protein
MAAYAQDKEYARWVFEPCLTCPFRKGIIDDVWAKPPLLAWEMAVAGLNDASDYLQPLILDIILSLARWS